MATNEEAWIKRGEAKGFAFGKAEGLNIGKARGIAIGEAKAKKEPLLRQLERRFGAVPEAVRTRVYAASMFDLDGWLDAVLDAGDIDGVFADEPGR